MPLELGTIPRKTTGALVVIRSVLSVFLAGCVSPAQSYNQEGVALFQAGQYEAARAQFQQAVNQDPLNADAFYNLGSTYHRLGDRSEAEWHYVHCLALEPGHVQCNHARVVLLVEHGDAQGASDSVRRWMAHAPGSPDPLVELAWLEKHRGDTEAARTRLAQALELEPRHPRALAELAALYEESDEPDRALVLYQRALAADPRQREVATKVASLRASPAGSAGSSEPAMIIANVPDDRSGREMR